MISPFTNPGTKIVCIESDGVKNYLEEGRVYTVAAIIQTTSTLIGSKIVREVKPAVLVQEASAEFRGFVNVGFALRRFRYAELPKCLTELLEPVNLPREALV